MAIYTVRLKSGTTGTMNSDSMDGQHADAFMGEIVDVQYYDENGNPCEERGRMIEVLEENDY